MSLNQVDWKFQRCAIAEETAGWSRGCNGDGRCIRREKSPGIALHRGGHATPALLDYGGIVMDQLRVPTRHGKCPPYMKIIIPSAESRARYDRYLFKRLSRYILYSIVKKCARVIVLHRKSRRRRRLVAICATSRCRMKDFDDCESR